tara:strand:- start:78 stop:830 length:753 start_codon:yes stop_codon:yes gene_type:complete
MYARQPTTVSLWSSTTTFRTVVYLVSALLVGAIGTQLIVSFVTRSPPAMVAWHLFNFDGDSTVPTWVASVLWLSCSIGIVLHIALLRQQPATKVAPQWYLLAAVSTILSIDEVARIHESVGGTGIKMLLGDFGGAFYWGWVIAGMAFTAVIGAICLPFLWALPPNTRYRFMTAGFVFLSGALGCEMIAASIHETEGAGAPYRLVTMLEETLEFCGVGLFLVAIHQHLEQQLPVLSTARGGRIQTSADNSL